MAEDDREYQRQCAAYARTVAWLRHTQPHLSDEEMDAQGLAAVDAAVYGADAKRDRNGNFIEQGVGSKGHETGNHLAAILRWQGREAYNCEVARIWKETPDHAKRLGLQQPRA
jgi:hypothetical protein